MSRIVAFVEDIYQRDLCSLDDVTMDVHMTDAKVELVEMGPFGGHTGCGSCLFHWLHDISISLTVTKIVSSSG